VLAVELRGQEGGERRRREKEDKEAERRR